MDDLAVIEAECVLMVAHLDMLIDELKQSIEELS